MYLLKHGVLLSYDDCDDHHYWWYIESTELTSMFRSHGSQVMKKFAYGIEQSFCCLKLYVMPANINTNALAQDGEIAQEAVLSKHYTIWFAHSPKPHSWHDKLTADYVWIIWDLYRPTAHHIQWAWMQPMHIYILSVLTCGIFSNTTIITLFILMCLHIYL